MALNLKLQMRLSQQLIMTPQLQQAIKLLQLSRQELEELIDQALIENPVLEESQVDTESLDASVRTDEPVTAQTEEIDTLTGEGDDLIKDHQVAENDEDWQQYLASGSGVIPERHARGDGEDMNFEATLSRSDTLHEHLRWQLEMAPITPLEHKVGRHLIGNMDDDGYLTVSILEMLESDPDLYRKLETAQKRKRLALDRVEDDPEAWLEAAHQSAELVQKTRKGKKAPPVFEEEENAAALQEAQSAAEVIKVRPEVAAAAEAVLRLIQQFDPIGVGSRDLRECLEVQLCALGMEGQLPHLIVRHDLKLLENKDLKKVARRRKSELDDVIEAYKLIMSLEPKPGRPFVHEGAQTIIPDVYLYKVHAEEEEGEDRFGQYRVVLNDTGLPRLRISDFYREMAENNQADSSLTHEYIQEKIKAGNWLMKSIEQRQKTILRVTRSILKHQYEFFEYGINHLKPLVLKDVAEDISVHESTVSRITTNKYAHTPQGIFELKYFFTSGIDQGGGDVISSKKIKDMIFRIISGEDEREPFTDIQIAERLSDESKIKVARRTVAKYREALNLLPSNKRKKLF